MEFRAIGAAVLRKLVTAPPPSSSTAASKQGHTADGTSGVPAAGTVASIPCQALLESLHVSGGRSEAISLVASLDLFGDDSISSSPPTGAVANGGIENGGGGGGSDHDEAGREEHAGSERQNDDSGAWDTTGSTTTTTMKGDIQIASWRMHCREDGMAVLIAVVAAVTAPATVGVRDGEVLVGGIGGSGSGMGCEGFGIQESEALSSVCVKALRALVRDTNNTRTTKN